MTTSQLPPAAPMSTHARLALWGVAIVAFMGAGFIDEEVAAAFAMRGTTGWLVATALVRAVGDAVAIGAILLTVPIRATSAIALERRIGRLPMIAALSLGIATLSMSAGLAYRFLSR
jgi:hypothetical protein